MMMTTKKKQRTHLSPWIHNSKILSHALNWENQFNIHEAEMGRSGCHFGLCH